MKVFINYKQNVEPDHSFARRIEERLRSDGHDVFRDESKMNPGDEWPARLEREVRACQSMVSLISNSSLRSSWVLNEIDLARKLQKRMLPFLLEEIDDSLRFQALNPNFMSTHWVSVDCDDATSLDIIARALAEPRHDCYKDLIGAKLAEHNVSDETELLEALCGVFWQGHWPLEVLGNPLVSDSVSRQNGESAKSLPEAIRNHAEVVAAMYDQNSRAYLAAGEVELASRLGWQVQRLRCFADLIDSLIRSWNETCRSARKRIHSKGYDKSPVFDSSDGEKAFAPLDKHSTRARFTPAPVDFVAQMHIPSELQHEGTLGPAIRLCEFFDDVERGFEEVHPRS